MRKTEGKRTRLGDLSLLAVLLANLICGVGLNGSLRADLSKNLVAAESALASSKINAYLWGMILRFTSAVEHGRKVGEGAPLKRDGDALTVAERIMSEVAGHNFIHKVNDPIHLTVSIGVYSSEKGEVSEDQIVSLADKAPYIAKKSGKNRVIVKVPA
jgi:GGDEF domain-containing protein